MRKYASKISLLSKTRAKSYPTLPVFSQEPLGLFILLAHTHTHYTGQPVNQFAAFNYDWVIFSADAPQTKKDISHVVASVETQKSQAPKTHTAL